MTATVQIAEHIQNTSHRIKLAQMQKRVGRSPVTKKNKENKSWLTLKEYRKTLNTIYKVMFKQNNNKNHHTKLIY